MTKTFATILLFLSQALAAQTEGYLTWPTVRNETKPWTRVWWPGGIATDKDITTALEKYSEAGIGGIEITNLYGVRGQEDKFKKFLSPEWMKSFEWFLKESYRLDLGVDLANAPSWPFGGPWVTPDDASKRVAYKTYRLNEGETLAENILFVEEPFIRWSGTYRTDIKNLKDPVYLNDNLQELSIDQIRFEKPLPLQILMAYSESGRSMDLTGMVDGNGKLNWTAPQGKWTLYAVFQGWHGKMVERAGPGGEGYAIDHFSSKALKNYLDHFEKSFEGYDLSHMRGFYNDSYEVDDARGQADWTPELFNEFLERRGYDLREHLPALFQKDDPEKNSRVLSDYRQTISDLILEKFTREWTAWANSQGKITRNQPHGSPASILDLYAASDIPETEGTSIFRMKFGTSGGNVSGKKLISAEASTWLGEHFSSTLADVKRNVDQYFVAGVNHIAYHGTCFSPESEPWPGFQFYAAVEFSPANSFWNDFPILNSYVTRVQSFLQNARPDNDILLYFPIFDRFSDFNGRNLEHFDDISPAFKGSHFRKAAELMNSRGFAFDYVSDLQIAGVVADESLLHTGGNSYRTIVVPHCSYIPVATFNKLFNLAEKGAVIVIYGNFPGDVSGLKDLDDNREIYSYLKEQISFGMSNSKGIREAAAGPGRILTGEDLEQLLLAAGARRETMTDNGLAFNRRKIYGGNYYFVVNQSDRTFDGLLTLGTSSRAAGIFDPMTGISGTAKIRHPEGKTGIRLRLEPSESVIIKTSDNKIYGEPYNIFDPHGTPEELKGIWKISFADGGPVLPPVKETTSLKSWTLFGSSEYEDFSGTAVYTIKFPRPQAKAKAWMLDLGKVCESARVFLNGREIARLIGPPYRTVIDRLLLRSENELTIKVSNLSANRIAYLDRNKVNWKKFYNVNFPSRLPQNRKDGLFDASDWPPRESGLIGPVTLTPVIKRK